jgi:hypothetical protein
MASFGELFASESRYLNAVRINQVELADQGDLKRMILAGVHAMVIMPGAADPLQPELVLEVVVQGPDIKRGAHAEIR